MQVAEILSDLTSLRACDHTAAMALVSARPAGSERSKSSSADVESDPDLSRARYLVDLHRTVKLAHRQGQLEMELAEAKESVGRAVAEMN